MLLLSSGTNVSIVHAQTIAMGKADATSRLDAARAPRYLLGMIVE